ncbi:MAG: hypothetical protein ACFFED_10975 [Candidatus Thorarchaeota archaeon]
MKKHALINQALLVMLLFLLVSAVATVNAQTTGGGNDDDDDDDDETTTTETEQEDEDEGTEDDDDSNDRELEIQVSSAHAEIKSKLASGANENVFKIEVNTGSDGLEFKVAYEEENATTETEHEFKVLFERLIEYLDGNENGVYDNGNDTVLQVLDLTLFEPIEYTIENGTTGQVHIFDVSTTDGIFTARLYASGEFSEINGTVVAPSEVKIDVIIRDFNFTSDDSLLALNVKLEAEMETEFDSETEDEKEGRATDEAEVEVLMTDFPGFFSWKETAEIDGVTYAVNSSIDEVEFNEQKIYLNYPQGNEIIHDPKIGFENVLVSPNGLPLADILMDNYVPLIAIVAIAVIGIAVAARRRT